MAPPTDSVNAGDSRPRVTLLTRSEFWRTGAGLWARTREVIRFLSAHTRLRVMFLPPLRTAPRPEEIAAIGTPFEFVAPVLDGAPTPDQVKAWIPATLHAAPADVVWVDKTELSWFLPVLPKEARTVVDTHDLMSKRFQSFSRRGVPGVASVSESAESEILARYSRVLCIQEEDRDTVREWLGPGRALLAPHPAELVRREVRDVAASVAFVASDWIANVDGIEWFLREVWPQAVRPGLTLDVYGFVCRALEKSLAGREVPGLRLHGHVEMLDEVYRHADILINPVRVGAGLKIKTVEALANGLPLVTTGEGARGLRSLDRRAFRIADSADDFAAALNQMVMDPALRRSLAAGGFAYASEHFTPSACFGEVLAWIFGGANRSP